MFENLLGQDEVRDQLVADFLGGRLPPALLLSGPPASGKLTAALELARALSCNGKDRAAWNCPCPSCLRHRALVHADLLLFGKRTFPEEIGVAFDLLERSPGKASAYFFVRSVRKLAKRFDQALYEGEEAKLAKALPLLRDLEERMDGISPERAEGAALGAGAMEAATAIVPITRKLEALVPDQPPVSMVRSAEIWARLSPWALRKTIIIENADAMQESARNALLKILEEPPSTLTFILLTSRRSSVIRTILSRVRTYPFAFRDGASNALVLGKVFRERELGALEGSGPALLSVEAWLAARRPFPPSRAREVAASFVSAVLAGRRAGGASLGPVFERAALEASRAGLDTTQALSLVLSETKDFGQRDEGFETSFQAFLEALEGCLGDFLRDGDMGREDLAWVSRAADLARSVKARKESYNLSPSLLIEGLAYGLSTP